MITVSTNLTATQRTNWGWNPPDGNLIREPLDLFWSFRFLELGKGNYRQQIWDKNFKVCTWILDGRTVIWNIRTRNLRIRPGALKMGRISKIKAQTWMKWWIRSCTMNTAQESISWGGSWKILKSSAMRSDEKLLHEIASLHAIIAVLWELNSLVNPFNREIPDSSILCVEGITKDPSTYSSRLLASKAFLIWGFPSKGIQCFKFYR